MSSTKCLDHKVVYGANVICSLSLPFWLHLIEEIILKKTTWLALVEEHEIKEVSLNYGAKILRLIKYMKD